MADPNGVQGEKDVADEKWCCGQSAPQVLAPARGTAPLLAWIIHDTHGLCILLRVARLLDVVARVVMPAQASVRWCVLRGLRLR